MFIAGILIPNENVKLLLYLVAYAVTGIDVLFAAIKNLLRLSVLDEHFLMSIASMGAFVTGNYTEAVAVMLLYQLGELFQGYAVNKSRKSITDLMDIRPDRANVIRDGKEVCVPPEAVAVGEIIVIKPGERIPLDGKIIEGHSTLDMSALTGESVPVDVEHGAEIMSGSVNLSGVIKAVVTKVFSESTVSRILELTEHASSRKSVSERFISVFASYYTPVVVILALILALVPPFFTGMNFGEWIYRALTFLVISCPCALVISVPLSFFAGIGRASADGILVKGSNFLEALAKAETVVFDKTGTLTKGEFRVHEIKCEGINAKELIRYGALAEAYSSHPLAKAITAEYEVSEEEVPASDYEEVAGCGVKANIDGKAVAVGNKKLMNSLHIECPEREGTVVYVGVDGEYAGYIAFSDTVKEDAALAVSLLKKEGIKQTIMLTGDNHQAAEAAGSQVGIDSIFSGLLPWEKVQKVEEILVASSGKVMFVGDGINDAPVLARADVGVAMGGVGSDAAIEAADVVLMTDEPSKLVRAIKISKATMLTVKQNIVFSLGVKLGVLVLGALGMASMWAAVFADVGVAFIAIINSVRILKRK